MRFTFMLALLFVSSVHGAAPGPTICDDAGLTGRDIGICNAYCVAINCPDNATPQNMEMACDTLKMHYGGGAFPCAIPDGPNCDLESPDAYGVCTGDYCEANGSGECLECGHLGGNACYFGLSAGVDDWRCQGVLQPAVGGMGTPLCQNP
jgi:hypothetical protein